MKIPTFVPVGIVTLAVSCVSSPAQSTAPDAYFTTGKNPADATRAEPVVGGGAPRPEIQGRDRSRALQEAIGLSGEQTVQIERILTQEAADCQAMGPPPWPPASPIRQRARDQIRALLTPQQRAKFNLVPESQGGGLFGLSPWAQLDWLDKLVHLTAEQKPPILAELIDQTELLMENHGPDKKAIRSQIRGGRYAEIRALLTPEQQQVLDAALEKHRDKSGNF